MKYSSMAITTAAFASAILLSAPAKASCGSCWLQSGPSEALMPSASPIIQAVAINTNSNMYNGIAGHLAARGAGLSSGDVLSGVSVWGDVYASQFDLESSLKMHGFDADGKGALVGLDKEIIDDLKVGIGFQYDQTDVNAHLRDVNIKTKGFFMYSEYAMDDWFVNGVLSYDHSDYSEKKHPGNSYIARYDVDMYSAQAMTGYHIANSYALFTPQAGLRYNFIKREAYVDGADQYVVKGNIDILTAIAGLRVNSRACGGFKPEAHANLTYDIISDHGDASVVPAGGDEYKVNGKRLPRLGGELGVGVSYDLGDWNFGIGYDFGIRKNYTSHSGMLKAQYSF